MLHLKPMINAKTQLFLARKRLEVEVCLCPDIASIGPVYQTLLERLDQGPMSLTVDLVQDKDAAGNVIYPGHGILKIVLQATRARAIVFESPALEAVAIEKSPDLTDFQKTEESDLPPEEPLNIPPSDLPSDAGTETAPPEEPLSPMDILKASLAAKEEVVKL